MVFGPFQRGVAFSQSWKYVVQTSNDVRAGVLMRGRFEKSSALAL